MKKKSMYAILITLGVSAVALITALCIVVVASLGFNNGLVAELFGNSESEYETNEPPVQTEPEIKPPSDMIDFPDGFKINGEDVEDWDTVQEAKKFVYDSTNLHLMQGEFEDTDGFTMYMAVDSEYLYLVFDVTEYTVTDASKDACDGDRFTISLDLGELCRDVHTYPTPVQYSFGKSSDGVMRVVAERQTGEDAILSTVLDYQDSVRGGDRVKNEISGSKILKSGWKAEFVIPWDVLIGYVCECYEVQSLEQLGLTREKLYASMCITYVDVSKDGSVNKIYRTDKERFLFLPQELEIEWLETAEITD